MIAYIFAAFLLATLSLDYIFLQKRQRRLLKFIALAFGIGAILSLANEHLTIVSDLTGIGRPVDLFVYLCCAVLVREFFLGRARDAESRELLTELVREIAVKNGQRVNSARIRLTDGSDSQC